MKDILPFTKLVAEEITAKMIQQDDKGIEKYGKSLDPMDSNYDWLCMAEEEVADMLKYFKAEQVRRDKIIQEIEHDLETIQQYNLDDNFVHMLVKSIKLKLSILSKKSKN